MGNLNSSTSTSTATPTLTDKATASTLSAEDLQPGRPNWHGETRVAKTAEVDSRATLIDSTIVDYAKVQGRTTLTSCFFNGVAAVEDSTLNKCRITNTALVKLTEGESWNISEGKLINGDYSLHRAASTSAGTSQPGIHISAKRNKVGGRATFTVGHGNVFK